MNHQEPALVDLLRERVDMLFQSGSDHLEIDQQIFAVVQSLAERVRRLEADNVALKACISALNASVSILAKRTARTGKKAAKG